MINVYQQPTQANPTLGMTFIIFKSMEAGIQHQKYPDLVTATKHFEEAKKDLLITNLEAFWNFCDRNNGVKDQAIVESVKVIRNTVLQGLERRDKYHQFLVSVKEKANFMRALVRAMANDENRRISATMMAASIMKFCKEELDEHEKNQSKE